MIFFLVNSKSKVDLTNKDLILLFGSTKDFRNKINSTYQRVDWNDENGVCTVVSINGILEFYFGDAEVIERFVMVDVLYTENPVKEVSELCKKYHWLLYDLDSEKYINPENELIQ